MIRVRYHSDCDYFAGCENMLANFFSDPRLARDCDVSFSYRASPLYEKGLRSRVPRLPRTRPLKVLDFHQVSGLAEGWPAPLRVLYKASLRLLLVKYWLAAWDAVLLYRSLGSEPIDVLHINNGGFPGAVSCLAAGLAGRLRGVGKIVHVVNNMAVPYDGPDRWLDWPLDRLALRCADVLVTGSEGARRSLIAVEGQPEGKVVALPNGISPRTIVEAPADVRRRLKAADGRPLIAVVAVLEPRKGHRVLLEALARLKKEGLSPMPFTALGGDGSLRAELEKAAGALGLDGDVAFLGWQENHFDLFNAADVVALPSVGFEDFPNVTIEAMSLGKAVAATRVGGVEEQIVDGDSGLLAVPGSAEDFARVLGNLCRDAGLRRRLGARARARFMELFTDRASVGRYLALYRPPPSANGRISSD